MNIQIKAKPVLILICNLRVFTSGGGNTLKKIKKYKKFNLK
jgi:hypothetical protein